MAVFDMNNTANAKLLNSSDTIFEISQQFLDRKWSVIYNAIPIKKLPNKNFIFHLNRFLETKISHIKPSKFESSV